MIRASQLLRLLIGAIVIALPGGCETTPKAGAPATTPGFVSLERVTGGKVVGPAYRVTLYEDGRVLFEGHASVKSKGTFTKRMPVAEAARIFAEMEGINLWEREPR